MLLKMLANVLCFFRILRIKNVPMSAAGKYTCRSNDDETSCDLLVYLKNRFLKGLKDVSLDQGQNALFECQMADKEAKVVWYVKGERVLEGVDDKFEVKVLKGGVHQLVINDCQVLDQGDVQCKCQDLKTEAKLEVKVKEEPPKVEAKEEQEDDDARIRGKYKGEEGYPTWITRFETPEDHCSNMFVLRRPSERD